MKKRLAFFVCTLNLILPDSFLNAQQPRLIMPVGHTLSINSVVFSPNGKWVVTASSDHTAKVWNAASGELIANLSGHTGNIVNAAFSPNGELIVTASWDHTGRVWNAASGELISTLKGHRSYVESAVFSPDGQLIVTASWDHTAKVWNALSGRLLFDSRKDSFSLTSATFSPDSKLIASGTSDSTVKVWNATTGKLVANLKGHQSYVQSAIFSVDGKLVLSESADHIVRIWNTATWQLIAEVQGLRASFSTDGNLIIAAHNNTARVWDARTGQLVTTIKGHTDKVTHAIFSRNGKLIATASSDSTVKVWNATTGELLTVLKRDTKWVGCVAFSPDTKLIITGSYGGKAQIWNSTSGEFLVDLTGHTNRVWKAIVSPDGKLMVTLSTGGNSNLAKISNATTGEIIATLKHTNGVYNATFSPDSRFVMSNCFDSTSRVWATGTGQQVAILKGYIGIINSATFSPDGKYIVTASRDSIAKVWSAATGELIVDLKGHARDINNATFSPDGKLIVTASDDRMARIWNAATGQLIADIKGHNSSINSASFSPDGKLIVTASTDGTARIWNAVTGRLLTDLTGHTDAVNAAAFSADGKWVLTASKDHTAKLWNAATGKLKADLKGHTDNVYSAVFSPDGSRIITKSTDPAAKIWNVLNDSLVNTIQVENSGRIESIDFVNGRVISSNQSEVSIYDMTSGKKLYTTLAIDSTDYLVYDSSGRYDGTAGARKLLYFVCGNEIIELDQVKDQLWVPNLAERIVKGEAINSKTLHDLSICGLIPQTEMLVSSAAEYRFKITPRRGGLGETVLFVNGIEAKRYKVGQLIRNGNFYELSIKKEALKDYFIDGRENVVIAKAYTEDNTISSRGVEIKQRADTSSTALPNLYAVMIGVSDYKGTELDLKYAAKDATDISSAVYNAAKKMLNSDGREHVFTYNLTTARGYYKLPEKASIKKTLEEIGTKATANDILLIFFAGHGVMTGKEDKKQFYFLTSDASSLSTADAVKEVGISTTELSEWMKPQNIKAQKRILIFDACNSGQAINDIAGTDLAVRNDDKAQQIKAIDKLNEKSGLFILSASATNQSAYEMGRYSQGLLTYCLLKSIKQQPDILEEGKYLNVSRWFNAAEKSVTEISKENGARQDPQIVSNTNFNIGIVDADVLSKIILPGEKPLFTASNFQNDDDYDDLEISKAVNRQLNDVSSRGADGTIVYMTTTDSPDAYLISGRYQLKEEELTIKINIRRSNEKTPKYRFEVKGKKNDVNTLVENIVQKAMQEIKKNQ